MGRRRRARQRWATIPQVPRKRRKTHPSARSTPRLRMRSKTNTPPSAPLSLSLSLFSLSLSLILARKNRVQEQHGQTATANTLSETDCNRATHNNLHPPSLSRSPPGHRLPRPHFFPKAPRSSPTTT